MANIYDVAKRARVSVATVSAVLNDSAFVSPGLKMRVRSAVAGATGCRRTCSLAVSPSDVRATMGMNMQL